MASATHARVLEFVRSRLLAGLPPTVREVQETFRFKSTATAREHLERLVAAGHLVRAPGLARGLRLPRWSGLASRILPVPVLGRVQAGPLAWATQEIEGEVWTAARYPPEELFALRVRGESMTGAGILPGDMAVVHRQPDADDGQIVVALVEDEATVKVLRRRRGRVELHPANPAFPVLRPDPARMTLLGRVVEVRRSYERQGSGFRGQGSRQGTNDEP
jgi:repressor LexA